VHARKRSVVVVLTVMLGVFVPTWATGKIDSPLNRGDGIVIVKSTRTLTLVRGGQVLKTCRVAWAAILLARSLEPATKRHRRVST